MRTKKGSAIILALFVIIVAAGLSMAIACAVAGQSRATTSNVQQERAYFAAEAGIDVKLAAINNRESQDEITESVQGDIDGALYDVSVVEWGSDGVDNDGNGSIDDAAESDILEIYSTGAVGMATRTIRATMRLGPAEAPEAFAAIHLYNPMDEDDVIVPGAVVNFSGNTPPHIDGRDCAIPRDVEFSRLRARDITMGSGGGEAVLAVAVHDSISVADVIDAVSRNPDRITGLDPSAYPGEMLEDYFFDEETTEGVIGPNSVKDIASFDPLDTESLDAIADTYASYASPGNVYDESNYPRGNSTMGTLEAPQITVINNESDHTITLSGTVSGAGVLIIYGDVKFAGTLNFAGIVLISQGQAAVDLHGTVLILGSMYAASTDSDYAEDGTILDVRGTTDVFFSREGLDFAGLALSASGSAQILATTEVGQRALAVAQGQ